MQFIKRPQLIAIAFAVFLIVLLLLLPRVDQPSDSMKSEVENPIESVDLFTASVDDLSGQDLIAYNEIQGKIDAAPGPLESIEWHDSLSNFWESKGNLHLAADELSEIADILQDKPSYFIAADAYFRAFQEGSEVGRKGSLEKSIQSYQLVLDQNPDDLEAMTSLGVCYVEGSALLGEAPMKGIGLLKQVLEKDPENINALVNLGYFATKSGQLELAVDRFKRIIEIDPDFSDAYLYLADVYIQLKNNSEAVVYLEKYKRFIENPSALKQFEDYIENIKKK